MLNKVVNYQFVLKNLQIDHLLQYLCTSQTFTVRTHVGFFIYNYFVKFMDEYVKKITFRERKKLMSSDYELGGS